MSRLVLLPLLFLPAACAEPYSLQAPGPWSGSPEPNAWNLYVSVANPRDLSVGQAATGSLGVEAAPPVERVYSGHRYPVPNITADQVLPSQSGEPQQGNSGAGQQQ